MIEQKICEYGYFVIKGDIVGMRIECAYKTISELHVFKCMKLKNTEILACIYNREELKQQTTNNNPFHFATIRV